ncbi:MAG: hypothetical protein KDC98_12425, partial [Planctomycetes bacterium]|nr:hypothetical protein [Planctomycetota bacterium]
MNEQDSHDLQRWLDGDLDAQEHAAFERRSAADAELRDELELQRGVGESLRRSFAVPDIALPAPAEPVPSRWPYFLAGVVSAAVVFLVWRQPWADPTRVMRAAVGRSWLAVCEQPDAVPD